MVYRQMLVQPALVRTAMHLPYALLLLLFGVGWVSAAGRPEVRNSQRRRQFKFTFPAPKRLPIVAAPIVSAPTNPPPTALQPTPAPQPSSVEVERAEIRNEKFISNQQIQSTFPSNVQFQAFGPQFREEPEQRASFRQFGTTTLRPKENATPIPILRLEKQQSLDGSYKSNYETGNSIHAEETGFVKNAGKGEDLETLVQFGSYSYTDPDGQLVEVQYQADEGGFRAMGSHLPTPPPVPPEVQKGLDIIFESIRREAELEAKKKKLKRVVLDNRDNYPFDILEATENRASLLPKKQGKPKN